VDTPVGPKPPAGDGTLRAAGSALVGLLATRFELVGVELREEAANLQQMLVTGVIAAFLVGSALVLVAVLVAAAFWETHRLLALAGMAALYALLAIFVLARMRAALAQRAPPFDATVRELEADLEAFRASPEGGRP